MANTYRAIHDCCRTSPTVGRTDSKKGKKGGRVHARVCVNTIHQLYLFISKEDARTRVIVLSGGQDVSHSGFPAVNASDSRTCPTTGESV